MAKTSQVWAIQLEAGKGSIVKVGLLRFYHSRGTCGHALADIRGCVTKPPERERSRGTFMKKPGFIMLLFLAASGTARGPSPLGPLGFECSQHRQRLRPSVDGIRSKVLRPFGVLKCGC